MLDKAEKIAGAQALINYNFTNPELCWEALQTKGSSNYFPDEHKRLALLGNALIRFRLLQEWFPTGKNTSTGNATMTVGTEMNNLNELGRITGLPKFVTSSPGQGGAVENSQVADTVKALVGAVDRDGGDQASVDGAMKALGLL
ncbi:putative ribonuclease 3 [Amylocarpus encephaloides]|uniref:Ribonuclease 3 n=1 Tax=Amylocarpus encephaloides TaxID=45428 RepID=A0A9P7Y6Z8_9HELO|nr:putative ribonuclease 3 [Amylocarpus encephaloides]